MQFATIIANSIALAVFLWIIYKAALPAFATPGRCRLLRQLMQEINIVVECLEVDFVRLESRIRKGKTKNLSDAIETIFSKLNVNCDSGIPAEYQPAEILYRIAMAKASDDADLAKDELAHWQRRMAFNWQHHLHVATQATKLGLLFTVVGVLLAFATISQMDKPFEMFSALSLAMVTTIVGLIVSLSVSHALLERFGRELRRLETESETAALMLMRRIGELRQQIEEVASRQHSSTATKHSPNHGDSGNGQAMIIAHKGTGGA